EPEQGLGEGDVEVLEVQATGKPAPERDRDLGGGRQDELGDLEAAHDGLPGRHAGAEQRHRDAEAPGPRHWSIPPRTLKWARMCRTCAPTPGVLMASRLRGRGRSTATSSRIWPGRELITSTRSPRKTASGMEWVMNSTVFLRSIQMRWSSRFMCSRVMA